MKTARLIWYAGFYSATAAILKVAGFALFIWLARTLPVTEYAAFGLLYAVQTGVVTFALAGVIEAVVGYIKDHPGTQARGSLYSIASRAFAITVCAATLLAGLTFMLFAHRTTVTAVTLIGALVTGMLLAAASFEAQIVRLDEKHGASLVFSVGVPLAGLGGGFAGFLLRHTVQSFFIGSAAGIAVALAAAWHLRRGFRRGESSTLTTAALLITGAPFVVVALFGWLNSYGNNYLVSFIFPSQEVARFTFVLTLSSILQLLAAALNQVWSPRFYQITQLAPIEDVERKNQRFYRAQAIALGLAGGVIVAVFPSAMRHAGGNLVEYRGMGAELALLLGYYVLAVPVWHCQNYFMAYSRGKEFMRMTLVTGTVGFVLWVVLMRVLGPIGIYAGFLLQVVLRLLGSVTAARKHWSLSIAWDGVGGGLGLIVAGYLVSRL